MTLDLLDYQDGVHVLEIVGLTQVTEILRGTVQFHGLGQSVPLGSLFYSPYFLLSHFLSPLLPFFLLQ